MPPEGLVEHADAVTQAHADMKLHQRRLLGCPAVTVGRGQRDGFLQPQDIFDVRKARHRIQQTLLTASRVAEYVADAIGPQLLQNLFVAGFCGHNSSWPSR